MGAPLAIVILLLLQVLAGVTPTPVELASKSEPSHASSTLVDNGDGTWTVSYRMDTAQDGALGDTRLDSGDAASPHGSDSWFEVGHQTNPSARFNGLLGLDLAPGPVPRFSGRNDRVTGVDDSTRRLVHRRGHLEPAP